jgi:hypothetical protein
VRPPGLLSNHRCRAAPCRSRTSRDRATMRCRRCRRQRVTCGGDVIVPE